jgi:iron(III) transport system substrate-binding protein
MRAWRVARWLPVALLAIIAQVAGAQDQVDVLCGVAVPWCESLAEAFRAETGIAVTITLKEPTVALAALAAERDAPRHDVWYSGSGDMHVRAAAIGLLDEYRSPLLPLLHDWALHQAEQAKGRSIGAHAGVVGIGYNSKALANKRLAEPRCWADLGKPEYRGEMQVANPSSSPAGYLMLATLVQVFGEDRAFELLKAMHHNATRYAVTTSGAIRAVARGETTIGVAMLHDGVAEIVNGFPVKLVVPCEGTGYDVGSIAVVTGAPHPANARRFYDWVLAPGGQRIAAGGRNFVYPANRDAAAPVFAPEPDDLRLIRFDFGKYATAAERKRLIEKWERDVHASPR